MCASVHHINVPGMRTNQKIKVGSQRVKKWKIIRAKNVIKTQEHFG